MLKALALVDGTSAVFSWSRTAESILVRGLNLEHMVHPSIEILGNEKIGLTLGKGEEHETQYDVE